MEKDRLLTKTNLPVRICPVSVIQPNIHQTFDGNLLYPSLQERAAHLLYMVIKNHPFIDGNKRIGCFLFLTYLKAYGVPVSLLTNEALVALALLTAQSDPQDKDLMTKLIMHVIPTPGNRAD